MKIERISGWKMAGKVAAVVALSAGASAQFSKSGTKVVEGRPVFEVSMEGDIVLPNPARRKIVLERADAQDLQLTFKMLPRAGFDPRALIPTADDMLQYLVIQGVPGSIVVLHVDTRAPQMGKAGHGGLRFTGIIDKSGVFYVDVPANLDKRGLFAYAEDGRLVANIDGRELVMKTGGALAAGAESPISDVIDLDQAAQGAYRRWTDEWTNLEFRSGGKVRKATLEEDASAAILMSASSGTGTGALGKIHLTRPRFPVQGPGHALPNVGADDDTASGSDPVAVDLADPQGGKRAGEKIELQRPSRRGDHVLQKR